MTYSGITEDEVGFTLPSIVKAFPTVARDGVSLQLRLPGEREVEVELYDASGAKVKTLWAGHLPTGSHSLRVSLDGVKPGAYVLRYSDGVTQKSFKLLKR